MKIRLMRAGPLPAFALLLAASSLLAPGLAVAAEGAPSTTMAATQPGCAIVDLGAIVRQSATSLRAQQALVDAFAPREAESQQLKNRVAELSAQLDAANQNGDAQAQGSASDALLAAQARYDTLQAEYGRDLSRAKLQALQKVLQQAGAAYQALGARRGYAKLYQKDRPEPVFPPRPGAEHLACEDKVDVSEDVIRELDQARAR